MKGASDRYNGANLAAKGFVIVMVVFFSALSFTLGFFVGKQGEEKKGYNHAVPAVQSVVQNTVPQGVPAQEIQQAKTAVPPVTEMTQAQPRRDSERTALPGQPASATADAMEGARPEVPQVQTRKAEKAQSKEAVKEEKPPETSKKASGEDEIVYTVQLGALKNAAEARRLKEKYARKGYKTSITVARTKNREKVYKVKAGEFRDRKDAELLSLKLKRNEGLHAFVTPKNE